MERAKAVDQLRFNFSDLPDKKQAWAELNKLTQDKDGYVRWNASRSLGVAFPYIMDKKQAQKEIHLRTLDRDMDVRCGAAYSLGVAFPYIIDKKQAQKDLHRLTLDKESKFQGIAYPIMLPTYNKNLAWEGFNPLNHDKRRLVRWDEGDSAFGDLVDPKWYKKYTSNKNHLFG